MKNSMHIFAGIAAIMVFGATMLVMQAAKKGGKSSSTSTPTCSAPTTEYNATTKTCECPVTGAIVSPDKTSCICPTGTTLSTDGESCTATRLASLDTWITNTTSSLKIPATFTHYLPTQCFVVPLGVSLSQVAANIMSDLSRYGGMITGYPEAAKTDKAGNTLQTMCYTRYFNAQDDNKIANKFSTNISNYVAVKTPASSTTENDVALGFIAIGTYWAPGKVSGTLPSLGTATYTTVDSTDVSSVSNQISKSLGMSGENDQRSKF